MTIPVNKKLRHESFLDFELRKMWFQGLKFSAHDDYISKKRKGEFLRPPDKRVIRRKNQTKV